MAGSGKGILKIGRHSFSLGDGSEVQEGGEGRPDSDQDELIAYEDITDPLQKLELAKGFKGVDPEMATEEAPEAKPCEKCGGVVELVDVDYTPLTYHYACLSCEDTFERKL